MGHYGSGKVIHCVFLSDPGIPGPRSDLWVRVSLLSHKVSHTPFADLTDVTLADEDNNSIPTDDVNRAVIGNVAMQVAPHGGQTCN